MVTNNKKREGNKKRRNDIAIPTQVIRLNAPKTMKPAINPIFDSQTRYIKSKKRLPVHPNLYQSQEKGKLIDIIFPLRVCNILLVSVKLPED